MKINPIIEMNMTNDEQVELTRLEDEVCDARDQVEFNNIFVGDFSKSPTSINALNQSINNLSVCESNLNKYIEKITREVMARINTTAV